MKPGRLRWAAALAGCLLATGPAQAQAQAQPHAQPQKQAQKQKQAAQQIRHDCVLAAAQHHGVSVKVLQAVAWQESRWAADAVGRNTDGSTDLGAFQINSIHLPELQQHGIGPDELLHPCLSAYVGAWHLARQVRALGNTWAAVGAYHSRTPARQRWYANQIAGILMEWRAIPAGPLPYPVSETRAPGSR